MLDAKPVAIMIMRWCKRADHFLQRFNLFPYHRPLSDMKSRETVHAPRVLQCPISAQDVSADIVRPNTYSKTVRRRCAQRRLTLAYFLSRCLA